MPFTAKALADGQLSGTEVDTLYTAPPATTTYIKWVSFFNNGGSGQATVYVYVDRSGVARCVRRYVLEINESGELSANLVLEAGDSLQASTSAVDTVEYTVSGVEELIEES